VIRPRRESASGGLRNVDFREIKGLPSELATVVGLQAFDRFVFVMSVLERYRDRDIRLLLGCSNVDVSQARVRALEQIGALAQQYAEGQNGIELTADGRDLALAPRIVPRLAASA
jgi:hypothetical protein